MKTSIMDFHAFLKDGQERGIFNRETVKSWQYAWNYVTELLPQSAIDDVLSITEEQISSVVYLYCNRNASQRKYDPKTVAVYKSRLRNSLQEFKKYLKSPTTYTYEVERRSNQARLKEFIQSRVGSISLFDTQTPAPSIKRNVSDSLSIPIPIRPDCVIEVSGIPFDLTTEEAERIKKVIMAYTK